jgi:hypothetical protein
LSTASETTHERRSATEVLRIMREQAVTYDPVDQLLQLQRELMQLELQHGLPSSEFYTRYQAGQMGDTVEIIGWAGRYRLFLELRNTISDSLNQVIAFPVPASA